MAEQDGDKVISEVTINKESIKAVIQTLGKWVKTASFTEGPGALKCNAEDRAPALRPLLQELQLMDQVKNANLVVTIWRVPPQLEYNNKIGYFYIIPINVQGASIVPSEDLGAARTLKINTCMKVDKDRQVIVQGSADCLVIHELKKPKEPIPELASFMQ